MTNMILFRPELFYFFAAIVFLFGAMGKTPRPERDYRSAVLLAAIGLGITLASLGSEGELFAAVYRVDFFSQVFKTLLAAGLLLVMVLCRDLTGISRRHHAECYLLFFVCTLALMMLVSGVHLLSLYVALELSSYCLYILVSLRKDRTMGLEAGIKYFLTGVCASALMLFGLALLYSATGAAYLKDFIPLLPGAMDRPIVMVGLLLTLSGFFFKLALFPLHFWVPDVYQGAANQVAAYIATVSKVAAVAVLIRVVAVGGLDNVYLIHVLGIVAVVTMTLGNLSAMVQTDLKRLLAYSSIAHAGYILIGVMSMGETGSAGVVFYALALLSMKITAFFIVVSVADKGSNPAVSDLAGLHARSPILALGLLVALFSMAGIPPFIGFTGKFLIFTTAMKAGYLGLVLVAMINVVISLYYYLRVLKAAYLLPPPEAAGPLDVSLVTRCLVGLLILLMVGGGLCPGGFIAVADAAAKLLLHP